MTERRKWTIGLAVLLVLAVLGAFGPLVRSRVRAAAGQRGAQVEMGRVWPAFFGVSLRRVQVVVPEIPAFHAEFDRIDVHPGFGIGTRRVVVRGGKITATGSASEIESQVRAYRQAHRTERRPEQNGHGAGADIDLTVDDIALAWTAFGPGSGPLEVSGGSLHWSAGKGGEVAAKSVEGSRGGARVGISELSASLVPGEPQPLVREVRANSLNLALKLDPPDPPSPSAPPSSASGARLPQSAVIRAAHAKATASALGAAELAPQPKRSRGLDGILQHAVALRDELVARAAALADALSPDAAVQLNGVRILVSRDTEGLNIGPGVLRARREPDRLEIDLAPGGDASASPLNFHASVPTVPASIALDVKGGPITLASLGVHEKDFGLTNVDQATLSARAHVDISADADRADFDGDGQLHSLSLFHAALADEPLRSIELSWRTSGRFDFKSELFRIDDGEVDLGAIKVKGQGTIEQGPDFVRIDGSVNVPLADCQSMLDSVPRELVPKVAGIKLGGVFSLGGVAALDTRKPDDVRARLAPLESRAASRKRPPRSTSRASSGPFRRWVYDADGRKAEILSGPGTPDWVSLGSISTFMEVAVTTTEDVGFRHHDGFDQDGDQELDSRRISQAGKFLRGASTITMQLAKNLYLEREKNLSRKLQEAVLTMYLEQELTKDEILELYFNSRRVRPDALRDRARRGLLLRYGSETISRSGRRSFSRRFCPAPSGSTSPRTAQVTPGWLGYLRKLMKLMHDRNRITDEELDGRALRGRDLPRRALSARTRSGRSARRFTGRRDGADRGGPDLPA